MNTLPKPKLGISTKDLFKLCASDYCDKLLKKNLLLCSTTVEKDSTTFESSFPNSLHEMKKNPTLPNGITKDEMKKVYSDKFAAKDSPGRKYYDMILSAPKGGKCPICGVRIVRNLDHYLPKALYPTLVVTPENLIPTCRDCNFDKHTYTVSKPEEAPLNPYFDNVNNEVWLIVELYQDQAVAFDVECPKAWSDILKARVKNHLLLYKLDEFYSSKAGQEIADEIYYWKKLVNSSGEQELLAYLKDRCESIERNELNSWKAALYRGLISQFSTVKKWLV